MAWYSQGEFKRSLVTVVVGGLITVATGISGAVTQWIVPQHPSSIDCADEYQSYAAIVTKHPFADVAQPPGSQVEKQCRINEFLASIGSRSTP